MLSKKLQDALNEQINYEIESAHVYLAMAGYASDIGLDGFENWFLVQYEEELFHAKKMYNFINEKGGRVNIKGFGDVRNEYSSILEAFQVTLEHEQGVTKRIYNLMDIATDEKEYSTISFLQWFIDEQVEEEDNVSSLISKIELVKDAGLYLLDKELLSRKFVEPTE